MPRVRTWGGVRSLTLALLLKRLIFVVSLVPFARLVLGAGAAVPAIRPFVRPIASDLTLNPIKYLTDETGYWSLVILAASLAVTPLRRLLKWHELIRLRRMLGLMAFFYAALHTLIWMLFDKVFDVALMIDDVVKRLFISVGMASFVIMLILAVTSNHAAITWLGRRWQGLHRLVYLAAFGSVLHFWWWRNVRITEPRRFAIGFTLLLAVRVWWYLRTPHAVNVRPTP